MRNLDLCGWHFAHPRTRKHYVACPLCGALYVGDGAPTLRCQPVSKREFRNQSHRWRNLARKVTKKQWVLNYYNLESKMRRLTDDYCDEEQGRSTGA